MPDINTLGLPFIPANGIGELKKSPVTSTRISSGVSFDEIFRKEADKLKFSGHAQTRMISREISLSEEEAARLDSAVEKARQKGAEESLVLFGDKAFIVSVPNKTVITAIGKEQLQSSVITNIDSAVFA